MSWHHRTIEYIDSNYPDEEPLLMAHEFFIVDSLNKYDSFSTQPAVAMSKQEAKWIYEAYNYPPIVQVDLAEVTYDECGHCCFEKYVWLDRDVPTDVRNPNE